MPSSDDQVAFLGNLQRLLSEGVFVSTYKYALLTALADIAVEHGSNDDAPLVISSRDIAEKFVEYYWRQSKPYPRSGGGHGSNVLRQNTGRQAGIVTAISEAGRQFGGSLVDLRSNRAAWRRLVAQVDGFVRVMPLWKLQTVGKEKLAFLYDGAVGDRRITLKPGVACCLRKYYPLIADLIRGAWVRYVRRFNPGLLGEHADLGEFLFGSERADLSSVVPILMEHQQGECFYCHRPLKGAAPHVDHFIPWSRYPVDLGHNFVLAHGSCNLSKADRLAATVHLDRWVAFQEANSTALESEFRRIRLPSDLAASARIASWAYANIFECRGLTWVRGEDLQILDSGWDHAIARLLNCH